MGRRQLKLKGLHDIKTSTGKDRTLGINISIGGLGGLGHIGKPSSAFKARDIPAKKTKKGSKTLKIRLFPEEGGLLKMYIEEEK